MNLVFFEINKELNSLHKDLYVFLKEYKIIYSDNFNEIHKGISDIIIKNFVSCGSKYEDEIELLSAINSYYKSKYFKKFLFDYTYYLLTLFFNSNQITYNQKDKIEKFPELIDLDNAIELLLVMLPRDITKNITINILTKGTTLYLLINSKSKNFIRIKNFENHYSSYTLESYRNGYSFISRPYYSRREKNTAAIIGNYGQSNSMNDLYIVILDLDNYCLSIPDGLNKIISVANFVFLNLFKYLPQEELSNSNIKRIEFYVLIPSLFAFLNHKEDLNNAFVDFHEFFSEFSTFVKNNTQIISFKFENDESIDSEGQIDDGFKNELNKYIYFQGTPKTQISGLNTEQLNELFKNESFVNSIADKTNENSKEISGTYHQISDDIINNFLNTILFSSKSNSKSKTGWNNLSEIGYIYKNQIYFPGINRISIVNKFKLAIENIANSIISASSAPGTLMDRFGHMFERYVEELLRKEGINILISQDNDPDVIAEYNKLYYFIECKAWLKDVELILGSDYIKQFKRVIKKIEKAKKQSKGWAKVIPNDINIPVSAIKNLIVLVPYPIFEGMYIKQEKELNPDIANVCTPEDLIRLIKYKKEINS